MAVAQMPALQSDADRANNPHIIASNIMINSLAQQLRDQQAQNLVLQAQLSVANMKSAQDDRTIKDQKEQIDGLLKQQGKVHNGASTSTVPLPEPQWHQSPGQSGASSH